MRNIKVGSQPAKGPTPTPHGPTLSAAPRLRYQSLHRRHRLQHRVLEHELQLCASHHRQQNRMFRAPLPDLLAPFWALERSMIWAVINSLIDSFCGQEGSLTEALRWAEKRAFGDAVVTNRCATGHAPLALQGLNGCALASLKRSGACT